MNSPTVFIVDDDQAARESVGVLCRASGHAVREFASATAFMEEFDFSWRGCLIVDLRMPGTNGLDLQRWLSERGGRLPVIMITGFSSVSSAVQAMQQGAIDFLEKPCRPADLLDRVARALERDQQRWRIDAPRRKLRELLESLSPPERFVLDQVVAGKANKVIAREARQSLRWVELRRAAVFRHLGVESLTDLLKLMLTLQPREPEA
jgi:FixJ family two-component response regulator